MVKVLSRTIHYLYTLLTGHATAFAVAGFFIFTGLFAGAATGEAACEVNAMGWGISLTLSVSACIILALCIVSPFFAPLTLCATAMLGFNVGFHLPLLGVENIMDLPTAFLGGFGSLISCAALCAACAVSMGRSFAWARGVRIPPAERFGRMLPQIGAVILFMLLYCVGTVFAGFGF